jgi:hypothetical protein
MVKMKPKKAKANIAFFIVTLLLIAAILPVIRRLKLQNDSRNLKKVTNLT